MTTFSYTTGNPSNLTAGTTASMNDIQGPFTDLRTFINGANIDTTNLATNAKPATLMGAYRTVSEATAVIQSGSASAFYGIDQSGALIADNVTGSFTPQFFYFDPANWAVAGLSTVVRLTMGVITNGTNPAFTLSGYIFPAVSGGGGANVIALDINSGATIATTTLALVANQTQQATPSADVAAPTAQFLALGISLPSTTPTNMRAVVHLGMQVRNV